VFNEAKLTLYSSIQEMRVRDKDQIITRRILWKIQPLK